jgi:very-short-patch-repair endonuclease
MPTLETDRARYLRKNMTQTEWRLWQRLSGRQLGGWKFRRQHPVGKYIVDFYCPAARLVIELDGSSHDDGTAFDYGQGRQAWLESQGYRVLRFRANYLEGVCDAIEVELVRIAASPSGAPRHLPRTAGRPRQLS